LVTKEDSIIATVEGQIGHETTRAVVHEDTLLAILVATISSHVENNVLQTSCLCNLPMNTSADIHRHCGSINDEVSNLTEKVILIGIPIGAPSSVWIRVDQSDTLEVGGSLDGWNGDSITHKLRVVKLDKRGADHISPRRKVHKCRGDC
jgi:hypothetical protein